MDGIHHPMKGQEPLEPMASHPGDTPTGPPSQQVAFTEIIGF